MKISEKYLPGEGAGREELLTFYSWSSEDANKAQEEWLKSEHRQNERGPLFQWIAAKRLLYLADNFEKNADNNLILEAVSICAGNDLTIPVWCAVEYRRKYFDVIWGHARKWDEAFGRPHKKGARISDISEKKRKMDAVWSRIKEIKSKHPEVPMDRNGMFEMVGRELGISSSLTEKFYYKIEKSPKKPFLPFLG